MSMSYDREEMRKRMKEYLEKTHEQFIQNLEKADKLNFPGVVMAGKVKKRKK